MPLIHKNCLYASFSSTLHEHQYTTQLQNCFVLTQIVPVDLLVSILWHEIVCCRFLFLYLSMELISQLLTMSNVSNFFTTFWVLMQFVTTGLLSYHYIWVICSIAKQIAKDCFVIMCFIQSFLTHLRQMCQERHHGIFEFFNKCYKP